MSTMDTGHACPSSGQTTNGSGRLANCSNDNCPRYSSPRCVCRIRELNDRLRTEGRGGLIHMTNGIAALGLTTVNAIFKAVAAFTTFSEDNDPWGEHDCAVMEVEGHKIIWKIDYYDRSRTYLSPDAADSKVTVRVLTVMLSSEY
jgi:hypothetical protein